MTKTEEIAALLAANEQLREKLLHIRPAGLNCTFIVLTKRMVRNERRIAELKAS